MDRSDSLRGCKRPEPLPRAELLLRAQLLLNDTRKKIDLANRHLAGPPRKGPATAYPAAILGKSKSA